jgi:serine O-acetyltransferase
VFDNVRADLQQMAKHNVAPGGGTRRWLKLLLQPTTIAVLNYRFGRWSRQIPVPGLRHVVLAIATVVRYPVEILTGVHISPRADIGAGFGVHTPFGVFVGPTKIGRNCVVQHGVVISYSTRRIGDNVYFGPGAKVMGPCTIGDNVVVVANSVVLADIPSDRMAIGIPARATFPRGRTLDFGDAGGANGSARTISKES